MSRLTMQEVIEHCEKTAKRFEDNVSFSREWLGMEPMPISAKQYLEHKQTAEWLKELQRYKALEEAGRLIELPCKAGDKLWAISENKVGECLACDFSIDSRGVGVMTEHDCGYDCEGCPFGSFQQDYTGEYSCGGEYGTGFFNVADFGKTIFLTKAEAERKLAELKGGAR